MSETGLIRTHKHLQDTRSKTFELNTEFAVSLSVFPPLFSITSARIVCVSSTGTITSLCLQGFFLYENSQKLLNDIEMELNKFSMPHEPCRKT